MDIDMHRSAHQDLRRLDPMGHPLASDAGYDGSSTAYNTDAFQTYWPSQDPSSGASHAALQADSASTHHQQHMWESSVTQQHSGPRNDSTSTHNILDLHYPYGPQGNSLGLKGASGLNLGFNGDLGHADSMHRSHRSLDAPSSQALALIDSLPIKASSSGDDSYEDSTDSDLPPEKKKLSAAFRPRGRKKRNKCTPDQLRSLEAFFEKNRNPTGRVRHELSRKLRMPERSVQVWFQNRRAKLKTAEQRGDTTLDSSRKKSCSIQLGDRDTHKAAGSVDRSARDAMDEKPSVTAIPTSALCIGTWRRVSPLICFFSRRMQSLTWYLTSESIGFKLEIPWTSISGAYFDGPKNPTIAERAEGVRVPLGQFVIDLERPPTFFMEVFRSAPVKNGSPEEQPRVSWRQCEDFTEDHQAMTVSRHVLNGPYEELRSAVQSLAACNEVLCKLIQFRDQDLRAAGAIPTGTGSTADNFGLVNNADYRSADSVVPSLEMSSALPGVDMYGHGMQMPMQSTAMSSSSSLQKSAAWNNFRTPMRLGAEHNWEFDSPASVTTNLSDASLDSHQRHPLGYSPYGVPTSIEASPRSGLGSSMDLNTLRIDAGSMSVPNHAGAGNMPLMGDGSMNGSRGHLVGWDGRLSYDMSGSQHMDPQQYPLASSGILPGPTQPSSQAMQTMGSLQTAGMDTSNAMSYSRYAGERQDYSAQSMSEHGLHQPPQHTGESNMGVSYPQETHQSAYENKQTPSDHNAIHSGSLLMSRRLSHTDGMHHGGYPQDVGEDETRPSSQGARPSSASQFSVNSMASTAHAKIPSFEEDAFSAKTPTHRTSFGIPLQLSHVNGQNQSAYSGRHAVDTSSLPTARAAQSSFEDDNTTQGRARSNTYRPSTHGGGRVAGPSSPMQRSDQDAEGEYVGPHDHNEDDDGDGNSLSEDDAEGSCDEDEGTSKRCATAATEAESPGLLSLSSKHPDSPIPKIEDVP